ncbi:unnamed protein product, partial [Ectocarpus fasciculatus]
SKAVAAAAETVAKLAKASASSSKSDDTEEKEPEVAAVAAAAAATAPAWPKSAWLEGLDPRAQVEAAMRDALRSAFGYGLVAPTAGVPAETLEAATIAAGNAAVA